MLDFYYNQLMRVHGDNIELYATDTDSIKFKASNFQSDTMTNINNSYKDLKIQSLLIPMVQHTRCMTLDSKRTVRLSQVR